MNRYEIWHKGLAEIEPEHLDTIEAESEFHALCLFNKKYEGKVKFNQLESVFLWPTGGGGMLTLEAKLGTIQSPS